jgi:hypothetical protein
LDKRCYAFDVRLSGICSRLEPRPSLNLTLQLAICPHEGEDSAEEFGLTDIQFLNSRGELFWGLPLHTATDCGGGSLISGVEARNLL